MSSVSYVLLIDGTNHNSLKKSNIWRLYLALENASAQQQRAIYVPGIASNTAYRFVESLIGADLLPEAAKAYEMLATAGVRPGDKVFIIGYSRGAVIARLVARLINDKYFYRELINRGLIHQKIRPGVEFLGLFEPVPGPLWLRRRIVREQATLSKTIDDERIKYYVEMSAIDERALFIKSSSIWDPSPKLTISRAPRELGSYFRDITQGVWIFSDKSNLSRRRHYLGKPKTANRIWFPGGHGDVGGGNKSPALNNRALLTMLDCMRRSEDGATLRYNQIVLSEIRQEMSTTYYDAVGRGDLFWWNPIKRKRKIVFHPGAIIHSAADEMCGKRIVDLTGMIFLERIYRLTKSTHGIVRDFSEIEKLLG